MKNPSTLSEQLAEIRRTRYAQVPRLRYVMQSFLASKHKSDLNRKKARDLVLDWARHKWPGLIPPAAYDGKAFEYDQAGLRIAATSNHDSTLWAFRSEHLDTESTASRTWVTEAVVAELGETDGFGVRNSCSTHSGEAIPATSPRFLRDFISSLSLVDAGKEILLQPKFVNSFEDLVHFISLLRSPNRALPIVAITQLPNANGYAVNPKTLAHQTQGLAHIYCIPTENTFSLSDQVGKILSVFNGAIRTYYPGFTNDADPKHHHLVFPQRVAEWQGEEGTGSTAFEQFLSRQIHAYSVGTPEKIDALPSYFAIRRALLEKPNKTTGEEIQLLRLELEEARSKEKYWENIANDRDEEALAHEEENRVLKAQNQVLASDLKTLRDSRGETTVPIPTSYAELPRWIDSYYSDRLYLHPRAIRALKDAVFENVSLVYKSLQILAGIYWQLKANIEQASRADLTKAWEDGLKELHVDYNSHSITANRLGEFKETYTINHKIGQSSKQILGPHLKFGSTKDDRYCMRIYFFWDDERQLVVIGHLPSHLETRAT